MSSELSNLFQTESPALPFDVIHNVLEHLVSDTLPLAFAYEDSVRVTLFSLTLTSKSISPFATKLLYDKVCIDTPYDLWALSEVPREKLALIRSLYVSLDKGPFCCMADDRTLQPPKGEALNDCANYLQTILSSESLRPDRLALEFGCFCDADTITPAEIQLLRDVLTKTVPNLMPFLTEFVAMDSCPKRLGNNDPKSCMSLDYVKCVQCCPKLERLHLLRSKCGSLLKAPRGLDDHISPRYLEKLFQDWDMPNLSVLHMSFCREHVVPLESVVKHYPSISSLPLGFHCPIMRSDILRDMQERIRLEQGRSIPVYIRQDWPGLLRRFLKKGDYLPYIESEDYKA